MMSLHFITDAESVRAMPLFGGRSAAFQAEPLRVSSLRAAATIARAMFGLAFLFLFIFGLTGLFAGV